jgi:hypothetical protein
MIKRFIYIIFLFLLSVPFLPAQTVIKIPFDQPPPFTVQPHEIYKSLENNNSIELGIDTEIHGGSGNYLFTWTLDGILAGTDPTLIVTEKGSYTLSVNDGEGCEATSVYHVDTGVGILKPAPGRVQIFPNPSEGTFFIQTPESHEIKKLEIFSIDGALRYTKTYGFESEKTSIDTGNLSVGSYLLVLHFETEKITKILVIR